MSCLLVLFQIISISFAIAVLTRTESTGTHIDIQSLISAYRQDVLVKEGNLLNSCVNEFKKRTLIHM